ncbi:MAG: hypothetical protein VX038_02105 [Verrucomicrobiota bacterium]|nr:hypothetical protein [Verrucomicrobiota bacterium]
MAQRDRMLGLIPVTTSLCSRTAHHKSTRRAENHFQTDRSHGVGARCTVYLKQGRTGGDRTKVIAHHHSVVSVMPGTVHLRDAKRPTRRPRNRLTILVPLVGQELPLGLG